LSVSSVAVGGTGFKSAQACLQSLYASYQITKLICRAELYRFLSDASQDAVPNHQPNLGCYWNTAIVSHRNTGSI
jgi:hypothetical protein